MEETMCILIEATGLNWKRAIKTNDIAIYNYFKIRLSNYNCTLYQNNDFDYYDCSILKINGSYFIVEGIEVIYRNLSLSACFTLVCMKYINIKKERKELPTWALHAAGFIYNDDLCIVIGSTHSGKSTTMFGLVNKNDDIKYLNDDITLFDKESLEVVPFCKPLQLRQVVSGININGYYVDNYEDEVISLSTVSLPNLGYKERIKYKRIRMFLLVRDNCRKLSITPIGDNQKYLSLMFNCYNDCIEENRKYIMAINNITTGYQITFPNGVDVSDIILSLL